MTKITKASISFTKLFLALFIILKIAYNNICTNASAKLFVLIFNTA